MDHTPSRPPPGKTLLLGATVAVGAVFLVASVVAWTSGGKAGPVEKATVPPQLGWVPADAAFFMHFRVADLWTGADGKVLREGIPDLERAVAEFCERETGIPPEETESVTLVVPSFAGLFDRRGERKFDRKFDEKKFDEELKRRLDARLDFLEPPAQFVAAVERRVQPREDPPLSEPMLIVTALKAGPVAKLRDAVAKTSQEHKHKDAVYYTGLRQLRPGNGIHFVNDRTLVIGPLREIVRGIDRGTVKEVAGPLAPALVKAVEKHHLVAGVHIEKSWALKFLRAVTEPNRNHGIVQALAPLGEARSAVLVADLGAQTKATLSFHFPDADRAQPAVDAVQDGLTLIRILLVDHLIGITDEQMMHARDEQQEQQALFTQVMLKEIGPALRQAAVKQDGAAVHASAVVKTSLATVRAKTQALWKQLEGDEKAKERRLRQQSVRNLKEIVLALHDHERNHKAFPPQTLRDKDGKPLLSWRVAILPFIGEEALSRQFKMEEAWDSPHNLKLLEKMPKLFAPVGVKTKEPHTTFYQGIIGPEEGEDATAWANRPLPGAPYHARGIRFIDIFDGSSNTFLVVEAGEAVPWTKPVDVPYDGKRPLAKLGGLFADGFHAGFADGSVRFIPRQTPERTLRAWITRRGGEETPFFEDDR